MSQNGGITNLFVEGEYLILESSHTRCDESELQFSFNPSEAHTFGQGEFPPYPGCTRRGSYSNDLQLDSQGDDREVLIESTASHNINLSSFYDNINIPISDIDQDGVIRDAEQNGVIRDIERPHQNTADCQRDCSNQVTQYDKPPHLLAKRNARERRRVEAVNAAYGKLRRVLPFAQGRSKRVSKLRILRESISYIAYLQRSLVDDGPTHQTEIQPYHTRQSHHQLSKLKRKRNNVEHTPRKVKNEKL